jgi:glycosyltransferase involved in cell wall biosynthesis
MPRVAIVCEYATLNGGENSMLAAVSALKPSEFECTFFAPMHGRLAAELKFRRLRHVPLDLHDATGNRLPHNEARHRLLEAIRSAKPDLVHANSLSMGRLTGSIAEAIDIPCTAHLRDILRLSQAAIDDLNRNRLLIAVSHATRDFHVAARLDASRTRVIYNGVDGELFRPRQPSGWLRAELKLPPSAFLVATIGQIGLRKGQDILARAAASLMGQLPDAHYVLIGERNSRKHESIEFEKSVLERFQAAGMSQRLHRLGYRDDMPKLLPEIDLLVHSARQEPLGRVLLEAAASGVPIVATDVGGTREILTDGASARLVPADDVMQLANAIVELHDDHAKRQAFAEGARSDVSVRFTIARAVHGMTNAWHDALGR